MNQSPPQQTNRALPPPNWRHWYAINRNSRFLINLVLKIWMFPKIGVPQIINFNGFNRVFHYKPSILGEKSPYFWKHPYVVPNMGLQQINGFGMDLFHHDAVFQPESRKIRKTHMILSLNLKIGGIQNNNTLTKTKQKQQVWDLKIDTWSWWWMNDHFADLFSWTWIWLFFFSCLFFMDSTMGPWFITIKAPTIWEGGFSWFLGRFFTGRVANFLQVGSAGISCWYLGSMDYNNP